MLLNILIKASAVLFSAGAGIAVAVISVSPFIWYMNVTATDGPSFPPALVALGFFGLPIALLLLPVQLVVALYEFFNKKPLGFLLLVIAGINGLLAGILMSLVTKSSQTDTVYVLSLIGVALLQSFVVYGVYWLWDRFAPRLLKAVQSRR